MVFRAMIVPVVVAVELTGTPQGVRHPDCVVEVPNTSLMKVVDNGVELHHADGSVQRITTPDHCHHDTVPSPSKLCAGASVVGGSADWIWNTDAVPSPSCTSPPVENHALMCEGDPTSVVIQGNGGPQCLSAHSACNFHMGNIFQLDFDVSILGCAGTWAAPLWMTPDEWGTDGPSSGEIDMLEMCPTDALYSNFAGGGTQKKWSSADVNNFHGHTTMWKRADEYGEQGISVTTCISADMIDGACPEVGAAFLPNIYDQHGCHDGNCMYHLISDIWNGNDGDGGYQYCASGQSHSSGGCSLSISNILFDAVPGTFEGKCAALTRPHPTPPPVPPTPPAPVPQPTPSSSACSAHPSCSELHGDCCPTGDGVTLSCCGASPSPGPVPSPSPPGARCSEHPGCSRLQGDCCPTTTGVLLDCCNGEMLV